ncbi:MAG: hypothetical protein WA117_18730 [Verrucomicrobiia bacterium]
MAQELTGEETMEGLGATQAQNIHDANVQRRAAMLFESRTTLRIADAATGEKWGKFSFPVAVYLQAAEFWAETAPTELGCTTRLVIGGVENGTDFAIPAGANYALVTITGNGILIPANTVIEPKFTAIGSGAAGAGIVAAWRCLKSVTSV